MISSMVPHTKKSVAKILLPAGIGRICTLYPRNLLPVNMGFSILPLLLNQPQYTHMHVHASLPIRNGGIGMRKVADLSLPSFLVLKMLSQLSPWSFIWDK